MNTHVNSLISNMTQFGQLSIRLIFKLRYSSPSFILHIPTKKVTAIIAFKNVFAKTLKICSVCKFKQLGETNQIVINSDFNTSKFELQIVSDSKSVGKMGIQLNDHDN